MAILPKDRFHVLPRVDRAIAEQRIRSVMVTGFLRPSDAASRGAIEHMRSLLVPFWRVDIEREYLVGSLHVNGVLVPTNGNTRSTRELRMVCAHRGFSYRDSIEDVLDLQVGDCSLEGWETLDADVDEERAIELAKHMRARIRENRQVAQGKSIVHGAHFVRYPIWLVKYHYRGRADPEGGSFHVGISAVDGVVVTANHPSDFRAGFEKLKQYLTPKFSLPSFRREQKTEETDLSRSFAAFVKRREP